MIDASKGVRVGRLCGKSGRIWAGAAARRLRSRSAPAQDDHPAQTRRGGRFPSPTRFRATRARWCACSPRSTAARRRCSGIVALGVCATALALVDAEPARDLGHLHRPARSRPAIRCRSPFSTARPGKDRGRVAAQVHLLHRAQRFGLGLPHRRAARKERPERAGLRHCRDAARLDGDVAAGGGHSGGVRRRHAADDHRRDPALRPASARGGAADGGAVDRRHRLFPGRRAAPARRGLAEHFVPGGEGLAHRRTRAGQAQFGRGAPPRGEREPGQVALSGDDEPRAAHAAQRGPRLLGSDEGRTVRSALRCRPTRNIPATSTPAASIS